MQCPRCHAENRVGRRFCGECGLSLALTCPACGFLNEGNEKFCGGCGAAVAQGSGTERAPRSPQSYTTKHLAERIINSKFALEGERKQGHRALRRPQELDGAARGPGSRGGDPRSCPSWPMPPLAAHDLLLWRGRGPPQHEELVRSPIPTLAGSRCEQREEEESCDELGSLSEHSFCSPSASRPRARSVPCALSPARARTRRAVRSP